MGGAFKLNNGTILLSAEAPGGLYNPEQLRQIAEICAAEGGIMKATEDQRLAIYATEANVSKITSTLEAAGLSVRNYQEGLHQPTSCMGALCPQHEQDALGSAIDLTAELAGLTTKSPMKIGINGCATCCLPCHTLDVSVVGDANGYRISVGGKTSQIPEMAAFMAEGVPAAELPALVKKIVTLYNEKSEGEESLQEVIERVGSSAFVEALAPYSQDAAGSDDPFADLNDTPSPSTADEASSAGEIDLNDLPPADVGGEDLSDLEIEKVDTDHTAGPDIDPSAGEDALDAEDIPINQEIGGIGDEDFNIAAQEFDQIDNAGAQAQQLHSSKPKDDAIIDDDRERRGLGAAHRHTVGGGYEDQLAYGRGGCGG